MAGASWRSPGGLSRAVTTFGVGPLGRASLNLISSQVVTAVLGYVFWLLLARTVEAEVVGQTAAVLSAVSLLAVVCGSGLATTVMVEAPSAASGLRRQLVSDAAAAAAASSLLLSSLLALAAGGLGLWPLLARPGVWAPALMCAVLLSVLAVLDASALSERRSSAVVARAAVASSTRVLVVLVLLLPSLLGASERLWRPPGVSGLLLVWAASLLAAMLAAGALARARLRRGDSAAAVADAAASAGGADATPPAGELPARRLVRLARLLVRSFWAQVAAVLGRSSLLLLPLLVTWALGAEANAGFFLSWQLASAVAMVSSSVGSSLLAEASAAVSFQAVRRRAVRLLVLLGAPATVAVLAAGPWVLSSLGGSYEASARNLPVFVLAAVASAFGMVPSVRLRLARLDRLAAAPAALALAVTVVAAYVAMPSYGAYAAAWALAAGQAAGAALAFGLAAVALGREGEPSGG